MSKKILVIDDRANNRFLMRNVLEPTYTVLEADTGAEGVEMVRREHPDLVICDLVMPGMTGHEVAKAIRADPTIAETPLILSTALYPYDKAQIIGQADQVAHVILLPIAAGDLLHVVEETFLHQALPTPPLLPDPAIAQRIDSLLVELKLFSESLPMKE